MRLWQVLGAVLLVPSYTSVGSRPISSMPTMTANERNHKHIRTLLTRAADTNIMTSSFGSVTSMPTLSSTIAEGISIPTRAEPNHTPLAHIDVPFINNSNLDNPNGKALDEEIGSPLFRKVLELAAPLLALSATLVTGWNRPPQEPEGFWTITNLVVAAALLPFHDQSVSVILGNVVKGVAVASNVLHYRVMLGKISRPAMVLVVTIVVYFLLYSQRTNVIPEGPEDLCLRAVTPWICAPIAIVAVAELFKLLQWLVANCSAMLGSIFDTTADCLHNLEHGLRC